MKKQFSRVMMIAGLVACSLFSVAGYSQQGKHTPEEKAKRMTDSLKSGLSLSDSQYAKVYDLNLTYLTKMQDLRQQTGNKEDKMQSMKELRKSQNKDLSTILTEDQMQKFRALQKQKHMERKGHHHDAKQTTQS